MKMIQIILSVIAVIIAGILIVALFIKKDYSISSEIIINRPKGIVFDYIKNIRNQENYSKWVMADPNVKLMYKGTDATVGFVSSWKSEMKNVGVGEQEVTAIKEGESIEMEIRFEKPFKGISTAITTVASVNDNQTKYTNTFNTRSPYPMNIMSALMKKMLKKDMDETSARLKKVLESE
jgi:uncharacterized protein YndB with AHSA1/START domain